MGTRLTRLGLALALALAAPAGADPDLIRIGAVELRLGAAQAGLLAALGERHTLTELRTGVYQVSEKESSEALVGVVEFRDGALTWASRDLGAFEGETPKRLGRALAEAIERAKPGEEAEIRISTQRTSHPGYSVDVVTLHFGSRDIVLYVGDGKDAVDFSMEEILVSPDSPSYRGGPTRGAERAPRPAGSSALPARARSRSAPSS
jgi:hypothetical protein